MTVPSSSANVTAPPVIKGGGLVSGGTSEELEQLVTLNYRNSQASIPKPANSRLRPALIAGSGLLILVTLWFLASGVAVQIKVLPANAQLRVTARRKPVG